METEGLIPCPQEPTAGPYPEPEEFIPHLTSLISFQLKYI